MQQNLELSIVVPVYNSAAIFPDLYRSIVQAIDKKVRSFEIIAVLDGCTDDSYAVISKQCLSDKRVKLLELSRNFGHQAAITAGLDNASGELIAVMDDDLEDPPQALIQLIKKAREGFDVVYGVRRERKRSLFHRIMFGAFYRLFSRLANIKIPHDAGDFCVMTSEVVRVLNGMPENNRYLRGLRFWAGFKQTGIAYDRGKRFANRSGYSLRKYFSLAFDAIFSFSYKPLRLVSFVGFLMAVAGIAYGTRLLVMKSLGKIADVPGWASLMTAIVLFSAAQLISIGIIGEYIARIYDEAKQRPKYIIMRSVGLNKE